MPFAPLSDKGDLPTKRGRVRVRTLAGTLLFAGLLVLNAASQATPPAAAEKEAVCLPVYLDRSRPDIKVSFAVTTPSVDLEVISALPIEQDRPLVVLVDPASFSPSELQPRIAAVTAAIAAELPKYPRLRARIGMLAAGGMLFDPPAGLRAFSAEFPASVTRLISETSGAPDDDPGRALELAARLLQKADADGGPVDCLMLGRDRTFGQENAAYLALSSERRILELCGRKGSVLHGYFEGDGVLGSVCASTGGRIFGAAEQADSVIHEVLAARDRGYLVIVGSAAPGSIRGRTGLEIRAVGADGNPLNAHGPRALWRSADGSPAPDYGLVRDALDWLRRSQEAEKNGDSSTALLWVDNAVQLDPYNPDALYAGGRCALEAGDLRRAEGYAAKAMQLDAPAERVLILFGEVLQKLGKSAQALEVIGSLPRRNVPTSPQYRLVYARLLASAGRDAEAAGVYASLAGSGLEDSQERAEYGCVLWRQNREAEASERINDVLAADPRNVTALLCSAQIACARGRCGEALQLASRAASIRPDDADVRLQVGKIQVRAHRWESALESLQTAERLAPESSEILMQLAEAEIQSGQAQAALQTMNRILAANPSDESAWREMARIYARASQFLEAASILEQGGVRFPARDPSFYQEAAALRERAGQYGQALLDHRAALQAVPPDRAAELKRRMSPHTAYLKLMVKGLEEQHGGARHSPTPDAPVSKQADGIIAPGGLSLLANIVGLNPAALKEPDAAGRVFSAVLESVRPEEKQKFSTLQTDLAQSYLEYEKLLRRMEKLGQFSLQGRGTRQEFVFPLVGDKEGMAKARRFLSFFGVKYALVRSDGRDIIAFNVNQDAGMQQRQRLLRYMGIDVQDKKLRELRFALGDETLSSIFAADILLGRVLGASGVKPEAVLSRFIMRPDAMKLYAALENCPAPLRSALVGIFNAKELSGMTDLLGEFGRFVEMREGRLSVPGAQKAWEDAMGVSISDPGNFIRAFLSRDGGRLVKTYCALRAASPSVQLFFTASAGRLNELSTFVSPKSSARGAGGANWDPESIRLIRMLYADDQGLFLDLDRRLGRLLVSGRPQEKPSAAAPAFSPFRLSDGDLAVLMGHVSPSDSPRRNSGARTLEQLKYIEEAHAGWLAGGAAELFTKNPAETAVYLDLIRGLDPPPEILEKYLTYCRSLAGAGDTGWNANRTRTSQSIFFLLSMIHSEGVISRESGWKLLESALGSFDSSDESAFLFGSSDFLTGTLFPELSRSMGIPNPVSGLLVEALAGRDEPRTFLFDGTPLVLDGPAEQMHRIKSALGLQRLMPLSELLDIIQLGRKIQNREVSAEALRTLSTMLKKVPAQGSTTEAAGRKGPSQAQTVNADLPKELEALAVDPGRTPRRIDELMKRVAGELHAELGTALLAHCYAYHSSPQSSALTYDSDFVRRHAFYPRERSAATEWLPARIDRGSGGGSRITGSLSGLGIQLHQLETQATAQSFGKGDWNRLLPAMLSSTRLVPRVRRSERAQEFVALAASLGREILALCASESPLGSWCSPHISGLLSPLRRENLYGLLMQGCFSDAVATLSPSEQFLLGEAYLVEAGVLPLSARARLAPFLRFEGPAPQVGGASKPPALWSPALDRLRELVPADRSPALDSFLGEVEQYGTLLWRRMGLEENALRYCDTYELLQKFAVPDLLFERIIDLKIRVAEIGYSSGLPASIGGLLEQQAIQNLITDPASPRIESWDGAIELITRLGPGNSRAWVEELLNQGTLTIYSAKPGER